MRTLIRSAALFAVFFPVFVQAVTFTIERSQTETEDGTKTGIYNIVYEFGFFNSSQYAATVNLGSFVRVFGPANATESSQNLGNMSQFYTPQVIGDKVMGTFPSEPWAYTGNSTNWTSAIYTGGDVALPSQATLVFQGQLWDDDSWYLGSPSTQAEGLDLDSVPLITVNGQDMNVHFWGTDSFVNNGVQYINLNGGNGFEISTDTDLQNNARGNGVEIQLGGDGGSTDSLNIVFKIIDYTAIPEPSTYALLLFSGAASLWGFKRRKG